MDKNHFLAEGLFTDELRFRLKEKRIQLGLTYFRLGNFLDINWSTIRKWERGMTNCCRSSQRSKFWDFISGEYDQALRLNSANSDYSFSTGLPNNLQMCMERLTNTYMICRNLDDLQQDLVKNIEKVTSDILAEMVSGNQDFPDSVCRPEEEAEELLEETRLLDDFLSKHY